jgi:hypothetical protein
MAGSGHRQHYTSQTLLIGSGLLVGLTLLVANVPGPVVQAAQSQSAIARGFETDQKDTVTGSIVSLKKGAENQVLLTSTENAEALVGAVGDKPLLEIGNDNVELQVVTSGLTDTLVSDINGNIQAGDKITASPVRGVGMKLTSGGYSLGVAQADLAKTSSSSRQITAKDGTKKTIHIAAIPVLINVSYIADGNGDEAANGTLLQRLASAVAGKQTSTVRIAVAFSLVIMGFAIMAIILRTSVATSMTSIGRNPLAETIIRKNFGFIVVIAFGIMAVALCAAYLALVL